MPKENEDALIATTDPAAVASVIPVGKFKCVSCRRVLQDWRMYEAAPGVSMQISPRHNPVVGGDEICGDCIDHAKRKGGMSDAHRKDTAARCKNLEERARTAHEFE